MTLGKPGATVPTKKPPISPTPSTPAIMSRSMTPVNQSIEGLRTEFESRPQTPTVIGLDKDEREEFLRRENELSDFLAEKESALAAAEKLIKELKEELAFLKEQEATVNKVSPNLCTDASTAGYNDSLQENKTMSSQLNDLKLQVERLDYDNKEGIITIDILKEQNQDANAELDEVRKQIAELKAAQKDGNSAEDKEKRKQEKMAMMMAKFDSVSCSWILHTFLSTSSVAHSKAPSPRRTNSYGKFSLNLTALIKILPTS